MKVDYLELLDRAPVPRVKAPTYVSTSVHPVTKNPTRRPNLTPARNPSLHPTRRFRYRDHRNSLTLVIHAWYCRCNDDQLASTMFTHIHLILHLSPSQG